MKLKNSLIVLLLFVISQNTVNATSILTCPPKIQMLTNGRIISEDRNWTSLTQNEYNLTKASYSQIIKSNDKVPIQATIDADFFSVAISSDSTQCTYIRKGENKALINLETDTVYKPYNIKNWQPSIFGMLCGNIVPENGKPYPFDYCQFTKSDKN